jgi:heme exporter protein B
MSRAGRRHYRALVRKDLQLEFRTRETVVAMGLLSLVVIILFQFTVGARVGDTRAIAGSVMWATLALGAVLGVGRTWVPEREQRVLDAMLMAPVSRWVMLCARATTLVIFLLGVQVVVVPLTAVFFANGTQWINLAYIAGVCVLADICIGVLGALLASMSVFSRTRELVLPVLLLPTLIPVVIAAGGATDAVLGATRQMGEYRGYFLFLCVYAVIFWLVAYATFDYILDD